MNMVVGWSLILSALWWGLQMGFVLTFFALGQPWGALSDLSTALNVLFLLPLALFLHAHNYPQGPFLSLLATAFGIAVVLSAAVASLLIFLGRISFEQSMPPVMAGFAAIGIWLALGSFMLRTHSLLPSGVTALGLIVGVGLAAIAVLFMWGDVNAAFTSGNLWSTPIIYPVLALVAVGDLCLPVWAVWFGCELIRPSGG
jgi:hypothetical protein